MSRQVYITVFFWIYNFLFNIILPFLFLRLLYRSFTRSKAYRARWLERIGFCPFQFEKSIWIHAVSVGETIAAIPLIKSLQKKYPHTPIVITNMTITGCARVKAAFGESVFQTYIPYDLSWSINIFLKRINPLIAIVMETELWPNLLLKCKKNHIPVILTNARLSEKSMKGYQIISSVTKHMLQSLHTLIVQTQIEAERFIQLGLPPEKAIVSGNLKFDLEVSDEIKQKH